MSDFSPTDPDVPSRDAEPEPTAPTDDEVCDARIVEDEAASNPTATAAEGRSARWPIPAEFRWRFEAGLPEEGLASDGFAASVYRPPSPRIWSAIAAGVLALPVGMLVSVIAALASVVATSGPHVLRDRAEFVRRAEVLSTTPSGLAAMVIPGQLVFLAFAFGAATLSSEHWRQRLRLVRGRMPLWTWPILAAATPAVAFLTSIALGALVSEPSDHMQRLEEMFRRYDARFLPLLFLLIAGLPGLAEELLYRGYVQSRLLRAWPARFSILLSALMFGLAHLDPLHALAVIPLGIWLGIIAWRADSLGPAILGHMINNGLALVMTRWIDRSSEPPQIPPLVGGMILLTFACLVASLMLLPRYGRASTA